MFGERKHRAYALPPTECERCVCGRRDPRGLRLRAREVITGAAGEAWGTRSPTVDAEG